MTAIHDAHKEMLSILAALNDVQSELEWDELDKAFHNLLGQVYEVTRKTAALFYSHGQDGERKLAFTAINPSNNVPIHEIVDEIEKNHMYVEWEPPLPWQLDRLQGRTDMFQCKAAVTTDGTRIRQQGQCWFQDVGVALYHGKVTLKNCKVTLQGNEVIIEPVQPVVTDDIVIPAELIQKSQKVIRRILKFVKS